MLKIVAKLAVLTTCISLSGIAAADHSWWQDEQVQSRSGYNRNANSARTTQTSYRDEYVYAEVLDVEPIVRRVQVRRPQRECWDEEVYDDRYNNHHGQGRTAGATIAGGLIGGVIGRQLGGGTGRDAMTVVGTLVGSAIAHDKAARAQQHYGAAPRRVVQRCETRYESFEQERIDGYHVTYAYAGRKYATRTMQEPGRRIRVRVAVTPVGYERS